MVVSFSAIYASVIEWVAGKIIEKSAMKDGGTMKIISLT